MTQGVCEALELFGTPARATAKRGTHSGLSHGQEHAGMTRCRPLSREQHVTRTQEHTPESPAVTLSLHANKVLRVQCVCDALEFYGTSAQRNEEQVQDSLAVKSTQG